MTEQELILSQTVARPRRREVRPALKKALMIPYMQTAAMQMLTVENAVQPAGEDHTYRMPIGHAALNQVRFSGGRALV